jgi:hypothetical protein
MSRGRLFSHGSIADFLRKSAISLFVKCCGVGFKSPTPLALPHGE